MMMCQALKAQSAWLVVKDRRDKNDSRKTRGIKVNHPSGVRNNRILTQGHFMVEYRRL